jgi:hypothetical protein
VPATIVFYKSKSEIPVNGSLKVLNKYSITPNDQTSVEKLCFEFLINSGELNSTVPNFTLWALLKPILRCFACPKSPILTSPFLFTKILEHLRSLCIIL